MITDAEALRIVEGVRRMKPLLLRIDPFSRIQNLQIAEAYPTPSRGICACGCGRVLRRRRRRWASDDCGDFAYYALAIHRGYSSTIRYVVGLRDNGVCAECGEQSSARWGSWEADHILSVVEGGGGRGLDNFQTLCLDCHKGKTRELRRSQAAGRRADRNRNQGVLALCSDLEVLP